MGRNTKYFLNTIDKEEKRFPNAVLRTYFVAFNLTNFVFDYKVAFSLSVRENYFVYKKNAGKLQESIKFPNEVRNKLNKLLFNDINFELIHKNMEAE